MNKAGVFFQHNANVNKFGTSIIPFLSLKASIVNRQVLMITKIKIMVSLRTRHEIPISKFTSIYVYHSTIKISNLGTFLIIILSHMSNC